MKRVRQIVLGSIALLAASAVFAQTPAPTESRAADDQEARELGQAISEAGGSAIDTIRALEQHLKKYPGTRQRAAIEKALAKASMDTNDHGRIIVYGEAVLNAGPPDDMQLIDRVTRALVDKNDPEQAKRALEYAKRYERDIAELRKKEPGGHLTAAQWSEELDHAAARALALRARATGTIGNQEEAVKIAAESWAAWPTSEGAREAGLWLSKLGRSQEAIEYYANAFTLEDPRTTETDRAKDRMRLGALYSKSNGSEKGLGDLILQAYDRTSAILSEHRSNLKQIDPNAQATDVFDFTLPALEGAALPLASLKGKTVVLDFWATWCQPCRVQHPMIEKVRLHFGEESDVVFLAIDTDEDRSLVTPFIREQGWKTQVYFESGLVARLNINAIPTVLILDPGGKISSRMAGLIPDRFEDMLTQRIEETRKASGQPK